MTQVDHIAGARYAQALFEAARKAGELDKVGADLRDVQEVLKPSGLKPYLENPRHPFEKKKKALAEIGKKLRSRLSGRFLFLLLRKSRIYLIGGVVRHFEAFSDEAKGQVPAEVILAGLPNEVMREKLLKTLNQLTGRKVRMILKEDPSIVGGIRIKIKNEMIDASIRSRLRELKKILIETEIN